MTEAELRALIGREPENGFRALFSCYKGYVYAIVWEHLRAVGTKEDAEECVSDVFTEVFLHFPEIREGALQGYIGTAAKRQAIDFFRRLTAKRRAGTLSETAALSVPSPEDVEAEQSRNETAAALLESIRSLGEPDATIVMQRYYYDRSAGEIAETVGMQPTAVRVRLSRALKRLKQHLNDAGITL
ncbi:MAG: sigma-70 family RNA polymerase sigma factor [Oscillospiraceae bacterium]|nr:sigma-70 family RNA polymerase sigma factor [Oscillospiraceae bacterium]MCR5305671.1 sigma-70 family RNA polymerase sigma factor [Oscillospiraceae bacterium]